MNMNLHNRSICASAVYLSFHLSSDCLTFSFEVWKKPFEISHLSSLLLPFLFFFFFKLLRLKKKEKTLLNNVLKNVAENLWNSVFCRNPVWWKSVAFVKDKPHLLVFILCEIHTHPKNVQVFWQVVVCTYFIKIFQNLTARIPRQSVFTEHVSAPYNFCICWIICASQSLEKEKNFKEIVLCRIGYRNVINFPL